MASDTKIEYVDKDDLLTVFELVHDAIEDSTTLTAAKPSPLSNSAKANILGIEIEGKSEQYISPNLIKSMGDSSATSKGVTYTPSEELPKLRINGTSNADGFIFRGNNFYLEAGTYTISSLMEGTSSSTSVYISLYDVNNAKALVNAAVGASSTFTVSAKTEVYPRILSGINNITVDCNVYPMLEKGNVAHTFAPYTGAPSPANPIPITDANPEVTAIGKNLFDGRNVTSGKYINDDGSIGNDNPSAYTDLIRVLPNTTYTFSALRGGGGRKRIHAYDNNGNWIKLLGSVLAPSRGNAMLLTVTTPSNAEYIRLSYSFNNSYESGANNDKNVQIELGTTATDYVPYESNSISIEENLFDKNNYSVSNKLYISTTDKKYYQMTGEDRVVYIPCDANTTYIISKDVSSIWRVGTSVSAPALNGVITNAVDGDVNTNTLTITSGANDRYLAIQLFADSSTIKDISVYAESLTVKSNSSPLKDKLRSIDSLRDALIINADGSGKIVRRVGETDLSALTWDYESTNNRFLSSSLQNVIKRASARTMLMYSDIYISITDGSPLSSAWDNRMYNGNNDGYVIVHDHRTTNVSTFKSNVSGHILYYPLATPIETPLTAEQVSNICRLMTYKGTTVIESEMDVKSVTYLLSKPIVDVIGRMFANFEVADEEEF